MSDVRAEQDIRETLTAFYDAENKQHGETLHPDHLLMYFGIGQEHKDQCDAWIHFIATQANRPNFPYIIEQFGYDQTLQIVKEWVAEHRTPRSHEIAQDANFDENWAAGLWTLRMPPEILSRAIDKAIDDADVRGPGALERHPAVLTLINWWNANAPKEQRAGSAAILVRPRSTESELQDGAGEAPSIANVALLKEFRHAIAFVAPATLILFLEPQDISRARPPSALPGDPNSTGWLLRKTVNGDYWDATGPYVHDYAAGEFDTAYETLRALRLYPKLFPVAYAALSKSSPNTTYGADAWNQHRV